MTKQNNTSLVQYWTILNCSHHSIQWIREYYPLVPCVYFYICFIRHIYCTNLTTCHALVLTSSSPSPNCLDVSITTRVEGSVVQIDWKVDLSRRQRRQSAQTVEPLALSINCSFPDFSQVRSYFWWSPIVGEALTLESVPQGASGTCGAVLYTLEGPGEVYQFLIRTEPVSVGESVGFTMMVGFKSSITHQLHTVSVICVHCLQVWALCFI